mgnify:CR=1 FL=1
MARYIPDTKTERWVIIASQRQERPFGVKKSDGCPFCSGNEHITPPEVFRIGSGEKDKQGWDVRVVPNLYAITDIHEVVIHSPSHTADFDTLPLEQVVKILKSYQKRIHALRDKGNVVVFCNRNAQGGASLVHPHSQIVVIPKDIGIDIHGGEPVVNIVETNASFVTYCPDYSEWPFEMWIRPLREGKAFRDLEEKGADLLAISLKQGIARLVAVYNDPALSSLHTGVTFGYNFYLYDVSNWYLRIIPRFVYRAGFELATGLSVNIVDPAVAAELLKKASYI